MSDAESYAPSVALDSVMVGATVSIVETSLNADYQLGDLVLSANGWQDYALSDGKGLVKLTNDLPKLSLNLGVLGMPGFTAYMGLLVILASQNPVKQWWLQLLVAQLVRWLDKSPK